MKLGQFIAGYVFAKALPIDIRIEGEEELGHISNRVTGEKFRSCPSEYHSHTEKLLEIIRYGEVDENFYMSVPLRMCEFLRR